MKIDQDIIVTILVGVLVWIIVTRFVFKSGYTPATFVAGELDRRVKQVGKDLNWAAWTANTDYVPAAAGDNLLTFTNLNNRAWELGHMGWRKDFSTNTVWWLKRTVTDADMTADTDAFMTISYGGVSGFDFPRVVVANRSAQDPRPGTDCTYALTPGTTCSATMCGTTGNYTDTWSATPATFGGTPCSVTPAPAAVTTRTCAASPCPVPCTWTKTPGTTCSATVCGTTGNYTDTWAVSNPSAFGGACAPAPASDTSRTCAASPCPVPCTWKSTAGTCTPGATCTTPGTIVNSWSVSTPSAFGGSCAPAPVSFNTPCPPRPCNWVPSGYF